MQPEVSHSVVISALLQFEHLRYRRSAEAKGESPRSIASQLTSSEAKGHVFSHALHPDRGPKEVA